jgi:hypothetical protein
VPIKVLDQSDVMTNRAFDSGSQLDCDMTVWGDNSRNGITPDMRCAKYLRESSDIRKSMH